MSWNEKSRPKIGRIVSDITRKRISNSLKGRKNGPCSIETKNKIADALRNQSIPAEQRLKLSAAIKLKWQDPKYRLKRKIGRARRKHQPFRNTKPELAAQKLFQELGVKFIHHKEIPAARRFGLYHQFDIILPEIKTVVEVDGCFWHGCPLHCKNQSAAPVLRNKERDEIVANVVELMGWRLIILWEHDLVHVRNM